MRALVCVKHVPVDVTLCDFDATFVTARLDVPGHLGAGDCAAMEAARRLGVDELVVATMGPATALASLDAAAALGATMLVHVVDSALAGSDTAATSLVLAAVARRVEADVVLTGALSDDGGAGVVPAQLAARLSWPLLGRVRSLDQVSTSDGAVVLHGSREEDGWAESVEAPLPAVVSVRVPAEVGAEPAPETVDSAAEQLAQEPPARVVRRTWSLEDLEIGRDRVGRTHAWTRVESVVPLEVSA